LETGEGRWRGLLKLYFCKIVGLRKCGVEEGEPAKIVFCENNRPGVYL